MRSVLLSADTNNRARWPELQICRVCALCVDCINVLSLKLHMDFEKGHKTSFQLYYGKNLKCRLKEYKKINLWMDRIQRVVWLSS